MQAALSLSVVGIEWRSLDTPEEQVSQLLVTEPSKGRRPGAAPREGGTGTPERRRRRWGSGTPEGAVNLGLSN